MSAIGPGDWVECVDNRSRLSPGTELRLRVGAIYRVREVGVAPSGNPFIVVFGARAAALYGFNADRFRPIYRPKGKQLIRDLLAPAKQDAPVLAELTKSPVPAYDRHASCGGRRPE